MLWPDTILLSRRPPVSLYRNFLNVGGLTLASRIAGFFRDLLMAAVLGTGGAADAFFAAFRFPNLFRRLFAEGAFNTAFVPLFTGRLEQMGEAEARDLAARIISWLIVVLVVVTVLAEIFMEALLVPFVPGFLDDPEKFELTVFLTRILFPYLACMSLMAAYGAILNGLGRFVIVAAAPILLNIVTIAVLAGLLLVATRTPAFDATIVAVATMAGGVAQLALVIWGVRRSGFLPRFSWPRPDPDVKRFWLLAGPAILAGGITQINIFVGTIIASQAESAISYLYYADRLYQLPLGIIGIAIGVVLLPELARHLKGGRLDAARHVQDQSLLVAMLLSMPAAAALFVLAEPIMRVLFERGAFDAVATEATAAALAAFAIGLPAFVLIRVFQPGFFAREDTLTPTIFAGVSLVVNVALSLLLFPTLQHVGIALATTVAGWINVALLAVTLNRRGFFRLEKRQWREQGLIVSISLGMAVLLWGLATLGAPLIGRGAPTLLQIGGLVALIGLGLVLYFGLVHLSGVHRLEELMAQLRRRPAAGKADPPVGF